MPTIQSLIMQSILYQRLMHWATKKYIPWSSTRISLYQIGKYFSEQITKHDIIDKAPGLSYNFMLALFPAIIFLFTLIPYVPIENFQDHLIEFIALILPENAFLAFEDTLKQIIKEENVRLLSFGFIFSYYVATNGIHNLMETFDKSSASKEKMRTWLQRRLVAFMLTLLFAFSLILGLTIITLGEYVVSYLRATLFLNEEFWVGLLIFGRWLILLGIYYITVTILYRYGPSHLAHRRLFRIGSGLATLLAFLTFIGFAFYINHFGTYNKIYGSIGTLIVMMIWLYLNSLIILLGFELNVSIDLWRTRNILHDKESSSDEKINA